MAKEQMAMADLEAKTVIEHDEVGGDAHVERVLGYEAGTDAEKRLVRKIDFRLLPCIWVLYLFSQFDRGNIGNAKTAGLQADFKLTSNQYSVCLLVFFISYFAFQIPSNLLIARIRPSLYLSGLCFIWGVVATLQAACNTWSQLAAVRFCIGITEAGFAPGVAFYLSSWYKPYEVARRFSVYYTATCFSGAFSGLLAGAITQYIDGARGIAGWRWLFIIEGVGSCFFAALTWFIMPDYPSTTRFLDEDEKILAAQRLIHDGLANTQGSSAHQGHWDAVLATFKDWRTIAYFVPTLIGALGWTGYTGQYHTIPINATSLVFLLVATFVSDKLQNKPLLVTILAGGCCLCFIVVVASTIHILQYVFMCFAFGCITAYVHISLWSFFPADGLLAALVPDVGAESGQGTGGEARRVHRLCERDG